ncbi:hypothetical protein [Microbacterium sp. EST19A]|uniref:hypothetical protein n=1 Tax=Microbacterium sp. EST19A TaxID=2862681 RepID=UPI001CC0D5B2|nr:hypothetical protein [Microbacterium sp. EST19A]
MNLARLHMMIALFRWDGWPNAAEWQAFWAFVTATIALVAAIIALRQYRISVNSRLEQARPFVVVDFRFLGALYACIDVSNAGQTAARNIRFEWSERPIALDERSQEALDRAMVDGSIPFLAPGRKISYMLNRYDDDQNPTDLPRRFEVKAIYDGPAGESWDSESVLDVDQWAATLVERDRYADVTSQLKKLVAAAHNQKEADEALTRAADSINVHLEAGFRVQTARQRMQEEREARWKTQEERSARLFGASASEPQVDASTDAEESAG